MKYKVGDKVRINHPGSGYYGRFAEITDVVKTGRRGYCVDVDGGIFRWSEDELTNAHKNCGCNDMGEPEQADKKERIAEVIKWLYINDRKFDSREQWKEELIKFLEEIL